MTSSTTPRALVTFSLIALCLAAAGCEDKAVTLQKELASFRFEQQEMLDGLYAKYGSGELADAVKEKTVVAGDKKANEADNAEDKKVAKEFFQAISNAALEMDRSAFDSHCIDLGKGERPTILSPRARLYFALSDVKKACHDVAQVEFSIVGKQTALKALGAKRDD